MSDPDTYPLLTWQAVGDAIQLLARALTSLLLMLLGWIVAVVIGLPVLALYTATDVFVTYCSRHEQRLKLYWPTWKCRRAIEHIADENERSRVWLETLGRYRLGPHRGLD